MTTPCDVVDFAAFYNQHFHPCCRWLRAMGVPESELEDLAQEVFVVVDRQMAKAELRDPTAWLYGIAWRTVSDHRRRTWWKNLFASRESIADHELVSQADGPVENVERAEDMQLLRRALERMSPVQRTTLLLFEIEGYSGEQIAALQGAPLGTVWTRLHKARRSFMALAAAEQRRSARRVRRRSQ